MDLALSSKQALFPTSHVPATMFLPHGGAVAKEKPLEPLRQLYALYMKIPHFPRFFLGGSIGNYIFYQIIIAFRPLLSPYLTRFSESVAETVCFVLSYLVEIPIQHLINALLVFGLPSIFSEGGVPGGKSPSAKRYWSTLAITYGTYSNAIWITAVLKALMEKIGLGDPWSFIVSVYGTGVFNYIMLSMTMK